MDENDNGYNKKENKKIKKMWRVPTTVTAQTERLRYCRLQITKMSILLYPLVKQAISKLLKGDVTETLPRAARELVNDQESFSYFETCVRQNFPNFENYTFLGVETLAVVIGIVPKKKEALATPTAALWQYLMRFVVEHGTLFQPGGELAATANLGNYLERFIDMFTEADFATFTSVG